MRVSRRVVAVGLAVVVAALGLVLWLLRDPPLPVDPRLQLRVVLPDGTPAVGARVEVGSLAGPLSGVFEALVRGETPPPVATFTTGADGLVSLPWLHELHPGFGKVPVYATLGPHFGWESIPATAALGATRELRLAVDRSLQVQVLAADGTPAPRVAVEVRTKVRHRSGADSDEDCLMVVRTDASGVCAFRHAQVLFERVPADGARRPFRVAARLPGGDVDVELDANALPADPVVLRLPAGGRLEITALDGEGVPFRADTLIVVADDRDTSFAFLHSTPPVTVLEHLPPGRRWHAWIPLWAMERVHFDGPRQVGDTMQLTLRAAPHPILTGQLLRAGAPVADAAVAVDLEERLSLELMRASKTDAAGRFRIGMPEDSLEKVGRRLVLATTDADGTKWHAVVTSPPRLQAGINDLGTLTLERVAEPPVLASGRVIAEGGLESVRLGSRAQCRWATLRSDGTFVVYGELGAEPGRLDVHSDRHLPVDEVAFARGQHDIVVRLRAGASVTTTLASASRELVLGLAAHLERAGDPVDRYSHRRNSHSPRDVEWVPGRGQVLRWSGLIPGRHQLVVHRRGFAPPLRTIEVDVPSGPHEVQVPPIDLSGLRALRIRLPEPRDQGNYSFDTSVRELHGGADAIEAYHEGRDWLLAVGAPVDLLVYAPGHRLRTLLGVAADTEVALEPGIPVELIFDHPDLAPRDLITVGLVERSQDLHLPERTIRDRRLAVALPCAGSWRLDTMVFSLSSEIGSLRCEPEQITVGEQGGTFRIRLLPDVSSR